MSDQGASKGRIFMILPLIYLMKNFDLENSETLFLIRLGYLGTMSLQLMLMVYIYQLIESKKDHRKIFVSPPKSPLAPPDQAAARVQSTYYDYELDQLKQFCRQVLTGGAITCVIHFYFHVNQILLFQAMMTPLNLYDQVLVKKYILGSKDRVWKELLEGEKDESESEKPAAPKVEELKDDEVDDADKTSAAIVKAWDDAADADFDDLWLAVKDDIDHATDEDKWTALMVACGSPVDTTSFIERCVSKGANVAKTDSDGWTALHWAAFHDRPEAASTLLQAVKTEKGAEAVTALLEVESEEGQTALEVAEGQKNELVVAALKEAGVEGSQESTSEGLRQRKKGTAEADAVPDVD